MIKLSVIIPVYNCDKYIINCLKSICFQKLEEIQIICVDDGSQDDSLSVIQEMQKQCDLLEVYTNEDNMGLALARNEGFVHALGEYVMFLDADDFITENILHELLILAEKEEADIVLFDMEMFPDDEFTVCFDRNQRIRKHKYKKQKGIEMLTNLIENNEMSGTATGCIYKRKYLEDFNIKFIEKGQHEDIPFIFHALLYASVVCYYDKVVYHYRQRNGSILHSPDYDKLLRGLISGHLYMQCVWEKYKCQNEWNSINEYYIKQYLNNIVKMIEERYVFFLSSGNYKIEKDIVEQIQRFHLCEKDEIKKYISSENMIVLKESLEITIYGAGYLARKIFVLLSKNGIKIKCFYVTDKKNNPSQLFGTPVVEYQAGKNEDCIVLAVSLKYQREILEKLEFDRKKTILLSLE